ncbi:unnamed protein product [Citrullus colocynthis]|uniref:Uncharacterized protein n=1 Tax=Citrullus colocynthis TaxID=252529 RepID=A0ABP0XMJ2_9ROSI
MEEFKAVLALKEKKITITSIYLTGDAKENPDGAGWTTVNRKLKKEVKDQFLPCNVAWLAPDSLRKGHAKEEVSSNWKVSVVAVKKKEISAAKIRVLSIPKE